MCGDTTTVQSSPTELRRRSGDVEVDILVFGTTPDSNRRLNSVGGDCDWFHLEVSVPNEDVQRSDSVRYYDNREESTTKQIKSYTYINIMQLLCLPFCSSILASGRKEDFFENILLR